VSIIDPRPRPRKTRPNEEACPHGCNVRDNNVDLSRECGIIDPRFLDFPQVSYPSEAFINFHNLLITKTGDLPYPSEAH
jgi:hypothetical protein